MDIDDPRRPLLGGEPRSRVRSAAARLCSVQSWRRRLPITIWLPKYNCEYLIRDAIAGITVGLTSIPQGIAYAIIAGLPPQVSLYSNIFSGLVYALFGSCKDVTVGPTAILAALLAKYVAKSQDCVLGEFSVGLYSSIFPGLVYALFGSCKDVTVGPTAILAALLAKYVAKSQDFAYLASFLSGCVILLLGVLQLGFLLDFISKPVISAFTTAAAMQISASQLKSLFRIKGSSGDTFIEAVINFFRNITTVQLWDTVLGVVSIILLILLKKATISSSDTASRTRVCLSRTWTYVVRARNALVVFAGALLAYCLQRAGLAPFALTGKIEGGLPHFGPPPFSTTVNNQTLSFSQMLGEFGAEGLVMPLVAILESIAIAKAFAGSKTVDGTQEMIAVGACNLLSSFAQSMPATGSFTRTALNHASGVLTPAGSIFKASLVLLSVTLLSSAFCYIPRPTLAGVIIVAMCSIVEFSIVRTLWRNSKIELGVWAVTVAAGAGAGLEYGIACGLLADVLRALAAAADPPLHTTAYKVGNLDCVTLTFLGPLRFSCASRVQRQLQHVSAAVLVLDGKYVGGVDLGVAENLITVMQDIESSGRRCLLWNFKEHHQNLFQDISPDMAARFVAGATIDGHILEMEPTRL